VFGFKITASQRVEIRVEKWKDTYSISIDWSHRLTIERLSEVTIEPRREREFHFERKSHFGQLIGGVQFSSVQFSSANQKSDEFDVRRRSSLQLLVGQVEGR